MARTTIGSIIDVLVTHEESLTPSVTSLSSFNVYDEAPENVASPAWLNFPERGAFPHAVGPGGADFSEDQHVIVCACVKNRALLPEDEKLMRPLITEFPDALSGDLTLGDTVAHIDTVEYEYGLIEAYSSPNQPMFGVLFRVTVTVKDAVSFAL